MQRFRKQFGSLPIGLYHKYAFYEDYDHLNDETRMMMHNSIASFGGIAPTYRIAPRDKPTIVWNFHSPMLGVQMMFSVMLTDTEKPIRICKHCLQAFVASRPSAIFCSPQCNKKYNVYKTHGKNK